MTEAQSEMGVRLDEINDEKGSVNHHGRTARPNGGKETIGPSVVNTGQDAHTRRSSIDTKCESRSRTSWLRRICGKTRKTRRPPQCRQPSPEYDASFLSRLTFHWIGSVMYEGYKRSLELNDIPIVNPDRKVDKFAESLGRGLQEQFQVKSERPLCMALYSTFKREFVLGGVFQLVAGLCDVISPLVIRYIIEYASQAYHSKQNQDAAPSLGRGIGLAMTLTCLEILQACCTNHAIYCGGMVGAQTRASLISVIFDKITRLSPQARATVVSDSQLSGPSEDDKPTCTQRRKKIRVPFLKRGQITEKPSHRKQANAMKNLSNGRLLNIMSTDTSRLDSACEMLHVCWVAPIQILLALAILIINIGYSALAGFAFICGSMPLLIYAIRALLVRRQAINRITDERVTLTQTVVTSIRFIKLFCWEDSFLHRLEALRKTEIAQISVLLSIRSGIMAVSLSMPILASMVSFIVYRISGHNLNAASIFSSLALFNALRVPLNVLPIAIGQLVDAFASISRIQGLLQAEEMHDETVWDSNADAAVNVENASFSWEISQAGTGVLIEDDPNASMEIPGNSTLSDEHSRGQGRCLGQPTIELTDLDCTSQSPGNGREHLFELRNINLSVAREMLVAVVGTVGSGKSSLLEALAGDMRRKSKIGTVTFGGARAFCPQNAWIQNATVRQNIVFGADYDPTWYNTVIEACALKPDFDLLPAGDLTEVGERGVTLSGGQKQRISMARAVYFQAAEVILLDDPLSAVDAEVGRHIFDNVICGLLNRKCRILATHSLHILPRVDRIIWMEHGQIRRMGTFENLMASDEEFQKLTQMSSASAGPSSSHEGNKPVQKFHKGEVDHDSAAQIVSIMQDEEKATRVVRWHVYVAWMSAAGSFGLATLVPILLILCLLSYIGTSLWLSWWTADLLGLADEAYIGIYAGISVAQAIFMFLFGAALTVLATNSSKVLFQRAIRRVLRAPMSFFDTTPTGRITNRMAKDVDSIDNMLTEPLRLLLLTAGMVLAGLGLIVAYYHYFAVAIAPLALIFWFSANYYRASTREIERYESLLRSAVYSRFSEAVTGTSVIRAYGVQTHFARSINDAIDSMDSACFLTYVSERWLAFRLDAIGVVMIFVVTMLIVTSRWSLNPSISGLVLSFALATVQTIEYTVRTFGEVEKNMIATERIHYYGTQLEQEGGPPSLGIAAPKDWPMHGRIEFENVGMRYRPGLPLALEKMTVHLSPNQRIGIVGRTGAGKSSVLTCLFRLVEIDEGRILIDGTDISKIDLECLRSRIAIIPQDPTLFQGTIRSNLDPSGSNDDATLWNALRQSKLVGGSGGRRIDLETAVEDEGLNFSLGQRQLIALARAIVKDCPIVVCDEATSSVDMETDMEIQRAMCENSQGKTLLCIAHRLRTVLSYDRILVMHQGRVVEFDTPINLWDGGGIFRRMCDQSNIQREDFSGQSMLHNVPKSA